MKFIKKELKELNLLLKEIPSLLLIFFILSIILMNILANKSLNLNSEIFALDAGIFVSWISFLTLDILTKHFGPKAATQISIFGIIVSLGITLLFFIISLIPGFWSSASNDSENIKINNLFRGTWYVLLGSTIAFIVSSFVNNFTNYALGYLFNNSNTKIEYLVRSYISTLLGQFVDNILFSLLVSHIFFGWSILQCFMCALTGMLIEAIFELIFYPIGYKICKKWQNEYIGENYFNYIRSKFNESTNNGH